MAIEPESFQALVLDREGDEIHASFRDLALADLPAGDVLVRVRYSGINYKDALAVTNSGRIARRFPMVPGIDLAGDVVESRAAGVKPGDRVLVTGYGSGEDHWGGFSPYARVQSDWIVPVPATMTLADAMRAGTAGFTAMLSIMALERHGLRPRDGEIAVTGASGGVGSFSVALLAQGGYSVIASTGRQHLADYLRALGATDIQGRDELATPSKRPLGTERWAGAVDSVGGTTLSALIRQTRRHGSIAVCGLAGGHVLETTVFPFILRGVSLLGIDSNYCPRNLRLEAWRRLASELPSETLGAIAAREVPLSDVPRACADLLAGRITGRTLVRIAEGK